MARYRGFEPVGAMTQVAQTDQMGCFEQTELLAFRIDSDR